MMACTTLRLSASILLAVSPAVYAYPMRSTSISLPREDVGGITALSAAQVTPFRPYTHYASTAYCLPSTTNNWTCGPNCEANPSFVPQASGGDGVVTQFWFVGYDPVLEEVIVSHQGTDVDKVIPDLTDGDLVLTPLNPFMFPGVGLPILVHNGFAATQSRSAPKVLAAVQSALSTHGANKVTVIGHSLGAAIALLDSVYLPLHLPNTTTVRAVVYGLPRVGNQQFADYVDSQSTSVTHINNLADPVPIVPPTWFGYAHPSGEIHIDASGQWMSCPGQDNPSSECIVGSATLLKNNETNHDGPYDGIEMGCPTTSVSASSL